MAGKLRTLPGKVGKLAVAHRNLPITSVLSLVSLGFLSGLSAESICLKEPETTYLACE
jgi:hypothetical protein